MTTSSKISQLEYKDFSLQIQSQHATAGKFVKVQLEVTYGCNLHCVHCYTDPFNKPSLIKTEMDFDAVCKSLDRLRAEGFLWLCFTGGEIFFRKDFLKIYDYAFERGFLITLFTNATLISDEIAEHLAKHPPFSIEISIYGATTETYERVTQVKGSFAKFKAGSERLASRKLPIKFKTSALTLNVHELAQMQVFAEALNATFKWSGTIYPRLNGDASVATYRLEPKKLLQLEFEDEKHKTESCVPAIQDQGVKAEPPANLYRCGCGKLNAHINPYGLVGTCTWSQFGRFEIQRTGIQDGMRQIAQGIQTQTYQENSACRSCTAFQFCDKIPEMAVYETGGNAHSPIQHFCDVAFGRAEKGL